MLAMGLAAVMGAAALFWKRELDPGSCESRCVADEACMRALDADGIAPFGSTRGDRGLCNGICSVLRSQGRQAARTARELGVPAGPFDHPCLPAPRHP